MGGSVFEGCLKQQNLYPQNKALLHGFFRGLADLVVQVRASAYHGWAAPFEGSWGSRVYACPFNHV